MLLTYRVNPRHAKLGYDPESFLRHAAPHATAKQEPTHNNPLQQEGLSVLARALYCETQLNAKPVWRPLRRQLCARPQTTSLPQGASPFLNVCRTALRGLGRQPRLLRSEHARWPSGSQLALVGPGWPPFPGKRRKIRSFLRCCLALALWL